MPVPLLLHTAKIYRKSKVAGKGISSQYQEVANGVKCLSLPQSDDYNITRDYVYGQDYITVFDTGVDVRAGDKLEISTGVTLLVSGKPADYKGLPVVSHIECACTTEGV